MTQEILVGLIGLVTLVGAAFGYWRYFESRVTSARDKTEKVADDLAAHKIHVAEAYVSKQGLRETKDEIMSAIHGVKAGVDSVAMRVDRLVEARSHRQD